MITLVHFYNDSQQHLFWAIMLVITGLSVLGSIAIIISYIVFPQIRNANSRIIVSLSVADLGTSTCGAVCAEYLFHRSIQTYDQSGFLCQLQAATVTYFSLSSLCWLATIAVSNYSIIIRGKNPPFIMELIFHVVCWGIPFVPTIIALCTGTFGYYSMLWCSYSQANILDMVICLTAFIVPVTLVIIVCYYSIIRYVQKITKQLMECKRSSQRDRIDTKAIYRMTGYIANYFIGWFPYFIAYIYTYKNPTARYFIIQVIISGLAHSQGITNFFLYCLNRSFLKMLRKRFCRKNRKTSMQIGGHRDIEITPSTPSAVTPDESNEKELHVGSPSSV